MHKIIHSDFEFDLTPFGVSTVEENYWFSDEFVTKYSFPGSFKLKGEYLKTFGYLLDDNAKFTETVFNVQYVFGNILEDAVFEITGQEGDIVEFTFRYGFEELPNFNKKLSELPLHQETVTDIYAHAKSIISQAWPAVNYNYPQIHTTKYDVTDDTWLTFLRKINNYDGTSFYENIHNEIHFFNKNIIQPLPYLLHILKQGFLDAGYTLKGDILSNELVKKILIYTDLDYFTENGNTLDFKVFRSEYTAEPDDSPNVLYHSELQLEPDTTYHINGTISAYALFDENGDLVEDSFSNITYKGQNITTTGKQIYTEYSSDPFFTKTFGSIFTTDSDTDLSTQVLVFSGSNHEGNIFPEELLLDAIVEREDPITSEIKIIEKVDLTEVVQNITFGEFFTQWRKYLNLDVTFDKKDIYINFIENQMNYSNATDLTSKEVLKPVKTFENGNSFLLKFANLKELDRAYYPLFHSAKGIEYTEDNIDDDTTTIEIDILPLPQRYMKFTSSAYAFQEDGNEQIYAVLYNGLVDGLNLTEDSVKLLLPQIHQSFFKKFFSIQLNSTTYKWLFKMFQEQVTTIGKKVFAYGRCHIVKEIEKTQIGEDLFEVEIETKTLP